MLHKGGMEQVGEAAACSPVVVVVTHSDCLVGSCCLHLAIIGSVFSKLSKLVFFRRVHRCYVQSLLQFGQIA